jgi:hypothetical protein
MPIAVLALSLHPSRDTSPQTEMLSIGRPRIMVTSWIITVVSPHRRWNMWVSGRHRSTSVVNAAEYIIDRPSMMSRASGRNPARRVNGVEHLCHINGMCVRILSGCNNCKKTRVINIRSICYNILMKSIKYIKETIDTYLSHVCNSMCSVLVVPRGLKQGELRVHGRHFYVKQEKYVRTH